jgi:PAS domain S-box-containing protein
MQKENSPHSHPHYHFDQELAFQNFFHSAPLMMGIADLEGDDIRHVADNEAAASFFGRSSEEMAGRLTSELGVPLAARQLWIKHYLQTRQSSKPVTFEYQHAAPEGEYTLSATVSYMGETADNLSRFSYIVQDLTETRAAQQELNNVFYTIMDKVPGIVWMSNADMQIEYLNQRWVEFTGKDIEQSLQAGYKDIIHPSDLAENLAQMQQGFREGRPVTQYQRIKRHDGEFCWHRAEAVPVKDESGKVIKWVGFTINIHEQKLLQQQLTEASQAAEQARRELHEFLMQTPIGMALLKGSEHRFVLVNHLFEKMTDHPQASGKSFKAVFSSEEAAHYLPLLDEVCRTGKPFIEKGTPFQADRYLDIQFHPFLGPAREIEGVLVYLQDVTDQEKFRLSEERFRRVVENMSEGLILFDAEVNLTFQNQASLAIHGFDLDQSGTMQKDQLAVTWEAWDENDRPINFDEWPVSRVFRHERFAGQILHVRRVETGHEFYGSYNGSPIYDSQGKLVLGFITIRDITKEVLAKQQLQESEARFREIANSLEIIIWTARTDGHIYWYNQWYFDYTGLPQGTSWDHADLSPIHPDDLPCLVKTWQDSLKSGTATNLEFRIRRKSDGQYRWHLSRGTPIRNQQGDIIKWVGSNTDIHEQKLLVEELEQERELRERFVATLTHDLRTPLTAAKINAQMAARKASDLDVVHRASARIVDSINRADTMIRDLLDVHRIKAGEKLPLELQAENLSQIIRDTLEDLSTVHGDRFNFTTNSEVTGLWSREGVRRMLENLCSNAIKYGAPNRPIKVELIEAAEWVEFSVQNEGKPIAAEEMENLFQAFRRSVSAQASSQKGWGLGLTLVRGLADSQGGSVSAESTGDGMRFKVKLPKRAG